MATFTIGKPITTREPTIAVDAGLSVGAHRFQLEVVDAAGNRSQPQVAAVTVQRLVTPVPPVISPTRLDVLIRNPGTTRGPL